jgi:hypothetical protein
MELTFKTRKMKQTALEWLGKELESYGDPGYCKLEWETLDSLIQQAKETEKEQSYSEEEVLAFGKFCIDKVADFLDGKGDQTDGQEYSMEEMFEQKLHKL